MKSRAKTKKHFSAAPYLWLLLPLAMMLLFLVYPAVTAIFRSFMHWSRATSEWVWFDNYISLFSDKIFWKSVGNMVILVVAGLLTGNIATLLLAELLFNMKNQRLSKVFRYLFLIPALVPGMVVVLLWQNVILSGSPDGLLNTILGVFNIEPQAWYFSETLSKFSFIITNFPWVGGISFLIYLAGLQSIPESCHEAARLDGANTIQRVFHIDLKFLVSQVKYFVIIGIVSGIQAFDLQLIITDGGPNYSTIVPGFMLYLKTYGYSDLGEASAIGVMLFIIAVTAMTIANKISAKSETVY